MLLFSFLSNNIVGGEIIHTKFKIFFLWKLGKNVYEKQNGCDNIFQKVSEYCSYSFGDSFLSYRESIHLLKKFYLSFPIYYEKLEDISWEQYHLLLNISNKKERYFAFTLSLFLHSDYQDTYDFIHSHCYERLIESKRKDYC